jgi:ABC-type transport system involved in multi-copper enzyme maturation permease subunit
MSTIFLIAKGTFGEAMRRKILNVFLFVALALIVLSFAFTSFAPRAEMEMIKSMGLGTISLAGVFISVILFINLIPAEIERRTIYTILSKPVRRWEFVAGKFLGGLMTVFVNIAFMGIMFILVLAIKEHGIDTSVTDVAKGVLMIFFQVGLLGGVALLFSVFLSPFVNFFLSFAVYLLGSLSSVTESLAKDDGKKSAATVLLFKIVHAVIPNFGNFNIQNPIIHPDVDITNMGAYIVKNMCYALIYIGIFLLGAVLIFDRREV